MSYIKMIINESKNDNKLFARYCFKFIEDIKNNNTWLINELNNESNLLNEFQIILLSGLFDLYNDPKNFNKYKDKSFKLGKKWGYEGGFSPTKWDLKADKLKERNIYLL